jgi:hypothetical protein
MSLGKRQKMLIAVTAISVLGFVVDTLTRKPAPAEAVAGAVTAEPSAAAGGGKTVSADRAGRWGSRTIAERLRATTRPREEALSKPRDPFHRAAPPVPAAKPEPAVAVKPATKVEEALKGPTATELARDFAAAHTLRATIRSPGGGMALVGDRMVRVGEGISGFKLVAIEPTAAVFEREGVRVRLVISEKLSDGPDASH